MGRFSGVFGLFQGLATVLITILAGVVSDIIGVKGMVLGGTVIQLVIATMLVIFLLLPRKGKYFIETEKILASS
jgi:hypothetical protein